MERRKSRGPKLVRRRKWSERLISAPLDYLLSLNEDFELIDWDAKSFTLGIPLGAIANILLLTCHYFWAPPTNYSDLFKDKNTITKKANSGLFSRMNGASRSFVSFITTTVGLLLITTCILNVVYVYNKRKRYTLLGRPTESAPSTPSAHRIVYNDPNTVPASPVKKMMDTLSTVIHSSPVKSSSSSGAPVTDDQIWQLLTWDPPLFNTYFASVFSPLNVFVIWYFPFSFAKIVFLICMSGYLYAITYLFFTLLKDRSVISTETMNEYSKKLVQPVVAVSRKDVCVGTDDDIAHFYSPSQNTKFVTRDVRPSNIRQSISYTNLSPYVSPYSTPSRNRSPSPRASSSVAQLPSLRNLRHKASINSFRLGQPRPESASPSRSSKNSNSNSSSISMSNPTPWNDRNDRPFN